MHTIEQAVLYFRFSNIKTLNKLINNNTKYLRFQAILSESVKNISQLDRDIL